MTPGRAHHVAFTRWPDATGWRVFAAGLPELAAETEMLAVRAGASPAEIVICVLVRRELPTPWRGIVDAAVVGPLAWGLIALLACFVSAVIARTATVPVTAQAAALSHGNGTR